MKDDHHLLCHTPRDYSTVPEELVGKPGQRGAGNRPALAKSQPVPDEGTDPAPLLLTGEQLKENESPEGALFVCDCEEDFDDIFPGSAEGHHPASDDDGDLDAQLYEIE